MATKGNGRRQLTAADVLALARNIPREEVELGDGYVWVRGMTGKERSELEIRTSRMRESKDADQLRNIREWVVTRCLVDGDGKRMFSDEQLGAVAQLSAADIDKLFDVAWRLSGMARLDVEQMGKASAPDLSDASASDSRSH